VIIYEEYFTICFFGAVLRDLREVLNASLKTSAVPEDKDFKVTIVKGFVTVK